MPPSIARTEPATDRLIAPGFGRRADHGQDRWPVPVAAAFIIGLSAAGWILLYQAARFATGFLG